MLKEFIQAWDKNKIALEKYFNDTDITKLDYNDLVKIVFEVIINPEMENEFVYKNKNIYDGGTGYDGSLLYILYRNTQSPKANDYIYTYINYGSSAATDTLQTIKYLTHEKEDQIKDLMTLCLHIIQRCNYCEINGETSDGYHTFNELYHHRAILFSIICNKYPELAWKSKEHYDVDFPMFEGMFIVGIETPAGQATYHYDLDPYWDLFNVKELSRAPKYDGHTPSQALERLRTLR